MSADITTPTQANVARIPVPGTRQKRQKDKFLHLIWVPAASLLAWTLLSVLLGGSVLPSPWATAAAAVQATVDGWLPANLWITLQVVLLAFVTSSALGLLVGSWLGLSRFWSDVLGGPLIWLYSLPKITIFPVFLLMFGLGDASRIAFGAFHGFFPLAIIVLAGIKTIPPVYMKSAKALSLNRRTTLTQVVLPASLPSVLSGLRFCFSLCFLGVILAEMFGSKEGAGYQLVHRIHLNQLPEIFAIALSLMIIALLVNYVLLAVENRFKLKGHVSRKG